MRMVIGGVFLGKLRLYVASSLCVSRSRFDLLVLTRQICIGGGNENLLIESRCDHHA